MSCGSRHRRYRSSVTVHPGPYSWSHATGHIHHPPTPLRRPVVYPDFQEVTKTADDSRIPLNLVQDLCARWQDATSEDRDYVIDLLGRLMASPRWSWDVTVLTDQSLSGTLYPFVSEHDVQPMVGIPMDMLRELWVWVLIDTDRRSSILRWWSSIIDPPLWQELRALQQVHVPGMMRKDWYRLYWYLSPILLPDIAQEMHRLLMSDAPDDRQTALTVLDRWLASSDHGTRTVAVRMLRTWLDEEGTDDAEVYHHRLWTITILAASGYATVDFHRWVHVVDTMVRTHTSGAEILDMLDRLANTILPSNRLPDQIELITTLWNLITESTLSDERREIIAGALHRMMQNPMVAALVRDRLLRTNLSSQRIMTERVWTILLEGLMQTVYADAALDIIERAIRQDPSTIEQLASIVASGWGNGHDRRILQMIEQTIAQTIAQTIESNPSSLWSEVLIQGITTSVGEEVCACIARWYPDKAVRIIAEYIDLEESLAPLPEYLIPWVCAVARDCPDHLYPSTIRRLWLSDPDRAWDVTKTMLDSGEPIGQQCAIDAMDAGWGRGRDDTIAATLWSFIRDHPDDPFAEGAVVATAVAGIGRADPSLTASLLAKLAMKGNEHVQYQLICELHRGWGRGQDDLVFGVVETIAERMASDWVWRGSRATLTSAWDYQPPHVVLSLIDRLVTRLMHSLATEGECTVNEDVITALVPGWTYLPTPLMCERITHYVAHLHAHAHTLAPEVLNSLVSAWAEVIAAGANRLSTADIHALLSPLWTISPYWSLNGIAQAVRL